MGGWRCKFHSQRGVWGRCPRLLLHVVLAARAELHLIGSAGAWFCSPDCHRIAGKMRSNVSSVPVPLNDKYSWQILRGKDGTHATAWALRAAQVGSF